MKQILIWGLLLLLIGGCFGKTEETSKRENVLGLSRNEAENRKQKISEIVYDLKIDLSQAKNNQTFTGQNKITFTYKGDINNLNLDFTQGDVDSLEVNGKKVDKIDYKGHFVVLPKDLINQGQNSVVINFSHKYSQTGSGLYKFKDKKDNRTYVYTDFEPYDANRLAPLFDQPNLKAHYLLEVKAPKTWSVVTSVREEDVQEKKNHKIWKFPKSEKYSTYIFSLHAGPYKVWSKDIQLGERVLPLRLFARQSLSKHVREDFWFKITEQGFRFFEDYFSTPYAYNKYDQVLVPDFNSGAMENVAAVTFNEFYVSRAEKPMRSQRMGLANVILHEMAHMWFGNLVTMNWWNDLWLNESFATYTSYVALYRATEFKEGWLNFFLRTKQWAYAEDQWRTTHPIEAEVLNTNVAMTNFDGITYGKGASSFKQLVFLMGDENFQKGLDVYFETYQERNTELKDFMGALQSFTDKDLSNWTDKWLRTKGLNGVVAEPICKEGQLKRVKLNQTVRSGKDVMRPHKTKVAMWVKKDLNEKPDTVFSILYKKDTTEWTPEEEIGCPKAIFPNWEDHDFVGVSLDEKSLKYFSENLSKVSNELLRAQVWASFVSMFTFGELSPKKIHALILNHLKEEDSLQIVSGILSKMSGGRLTYNLYDYYTDKEESETDKTEMKDFLKNQVLKSESVDLKKTYFSNWLSYTNKKDVEDLKACLKQNCNFELGYKLDPDTRWGVIVRLAAFRANGIENLIESELQKDSSRRAQLYSLMSEVLLSKDKKEWIEKAFNNKELKLKERQIILNSFQTSIQREEVVELKDKTYFKYIDKLQDYPSRLQNTFAAVFGPFYCGNFESSGAVSEEDIRASKWSPGVKKILLKHLDVEERCLKIKNN